MVFEVKNTAKSRRYVLALFLSAGAYCLSGCAATENQLAIPYAIQLVGTADQNLTQQNQAAPLQITVFQLRAADRFEAADYFGLVQQPQQVLGDQLLGHEAVVVEPEQKQWVSSSGDVNARYVGVVAGYRDLNQSQWRLVMPLPEAKKTNIYKFWQFSPKQAEVRVVLTRQGLQLDSSF